MCDIDYWGDFEPCAVWKETTVESAVKRHKCDTCGTVIKEGKSYSKIFYVFDGIASTEKQCENCNNIGETFKKEHHIKPNPRYLVEMLKECVSDSKDYGKQEEAEYWQSRIDEIRLRGRVDR